MLLQQTVLAFILHISGVQAQGSRICAFRGSTVTLRCSAHPTTSMKWYAQYWDGSTFVLNEVTEDESRVTANNSDQSHLKLHIKNLQDSDAKFYCCSGVMDKPALCISNSTQIQLADLQVKVLPETGQDEVTLMCKSSCRLSEEPEAYIWYRNGHFLYEDWSPWYQQLVSSSHTVRYSCAIKGYEHLRAPEVSVDAVTPTCFSVTYAKGKMCSGEQRSVGEPCSITYPREIKVQLASPSASDPTLKCTHSCALAHLHIAYTWYPKPILPQKLWETSEISAVSPSESFSCAIQGLEELHSDEMCADDKDCWSVNYVQKRVCALQDSSVTLSSKYGHPKNQAPVSWSKKGINGGHIDGIEAQGHVEMTNHSLTIKNLKKNNSAEYSFVLDKPNNQLKRSNFGGVILVVTELIVVLDPAEATEGQTVTLRCSTSCPLGNSTAYTWYLNQKPLTSQSRNKEWVLDPVLSQDAGNYSCAVEINEELTGKSSEKTLVVQANKWLVAAAGASGGLMVTILLVCYWINGGWKTSHPPESTEEMDNTGIELNQLNPDPVSENIPAPLGEKN